MKKKLTYGQVAWLLARILSRAWKHEITISFIQRNELVRISTPKLMKTASEPFSFTVKTGL